MRLGGRVRREEKKKCQEGIVKQKVPISNLIGKGKGKRKKKRREKKRRGKRMIRAKKKRRRGRCWWKNLTIMRGL